MCAEQSFPGSEVIEHICSLDFGSRDQVFLEADCFMSLIPSAASEDHWLIHLEVRFHEKLLHVAPSHI